LTSGAESKLQEIRDWVSKRKDNKVALVDFDKLAWMDHSPPGTYGHNWHYQVRMLAHNQCCKSAGRLNHRALICSADGTAVASLVHAPAFPAAGS
jgi:hypothetical protein